MLSLQRYEILQKLFVTFVFWISSTTSSQADLVAHWKLDEGEGENFLNSIDNEFDGYLLNEAVTSEWIEVIPTGDGSGPNQKHAVRLSGSQSWIHTDFPGIGGNAARTVSFWVKTSQDLQQPNGIVAWGDSTATGGKWQVLLNRNGSAGPLNAVRVSGGGGGSGDGVVVGTTGLADGQWHHVACVFPEGATMISEVLHFVDGRPDANSSVREVAVNTLIGGSASPLTIGMRVNQLGTRQFFTGSVADVRVFNEALDQQGVLEIMSPVFSRGDCNDDGAVDLSDAVCILSWLFLGQAEPGCKAATNIDGIGEVDVTDPIYLLTHLFLGGPVPPEPFPGCATLELEADRRLGCEITPKNCQD